MEFTTGTWIDWLWLIPMLIGTITIWSVAIEVWRSKANTKQSQ